MAWVFTDFNGEYKSPLSPSQLSNVYRKVCKLLRFSHEQPTTPDTQDVNSKSQRTRFTLGKDVLPQQVNAGGKNEKHRISEETKRQVKAGSG